MDKVKHKATSAKKTCIQYKPILKTKKVHVTCKLAVASTIGKFGGILNENETKQEDKIEKQGHPDVHQLNHQAKSHKNNGL